MDYLSEFPKMILLIAAWGFAQSTQGTQLGQLLVVAGAIYLVVLILEPPVRFIANRFSLTPDALVHDRGITHRTVRAIRWESISACDVDAPWAHRLLGVSRLTLSQADGEEARVVIRGADASLVGRVQQRLVGLGPPPDPDVETVPCAPTPSVYAVLIHRAGPGELAVMSLAYGQAAVVGLALLMSLGDVADQFGMLGPFGSLVRGIPWAALVAAGLALGLASGMVATLARFHDFRVERLSDGQYLATYGLIARRTRRFDAGSVRGLVIHRNLVELVLGRARLGVLTRDSAASMSGNIIIPSAPLATVESVAREHFALFAPPPSAVPDGRETLHALGVVASVFLPPVGVGFLTVSQGLPLWNGVVFAILSWLLLWFVVQAVTTRFRWDADTARLTVITRFTYCRRTSLQARCIHGLGTAAWRSAPQLLCWAWLGVYAGGPRLFIALRPQAQDLRAVAEALTIRHCPRGESIR